MPKKPIDWSRCIIYKIYKDGIDDFYIGSTTDFIKRKSAHKTLSKTSNIKIYKIIRDNGGWDEWIMTAIEEYKDCENQTQARIKEEEWRVKLNATVNIIKAYRSIEQYKEQKKEYRQKKEYKEQQKEYRELNKEQKKEYDKEYKKNNIDKIKEYKKETIYCDFCKKDINKNNKSQHYKSKLHINNSTCEMNS
jgi:hypothetical protein